MPRTSGSICLDHDGLTANLGSANVTCTWADVSRVVAFKRDEITTDLLCLEIETRGRQIELNEDMEGWPELLEQISTHLPGALTGRAILGGVVQPAFAANRTLVYDRDAA